MGYIHQNIFNTQETQISTHSKLLGHREKYFLVRCILKKIFNDCFKTEITNTNDKGGAECFGSIGKDMKYDQIAPSVESTNVEVDTL